MSDWLRKRFKRWLFADEAMAPSAVNNRMRMVMAETRADYYAKLSGFLNHE